MAPIGAESLGEVIVHVLRETCELLNEKEAAGRQRKQELWGNCFHFYHLGRPGVEG